MKSLRALRQWVQVVFAPANMNSVGVFDVATSAFTLVDINSTISIGNKFSGDAVGTKVVFAPGGQTAWACSAPLAPYIADITAIISINNLFRGAVAVGTKVVFAPLFADGVGVFDVATSSFTLIDISSTISINKFSGAAKLAPWSCLHRIGQTV